MTDNFIQLGKSNLLRLGIKDSEGNETGEFLEFDLENPQILLDLNEMIERHEKLWKNTRNQLIIIKKRPDKKGKKILSYNTEEEINLIKKFFDEIEKNFDLFLGNGGTKKLLNGRSFNFSTLAEIKKIIIKQIYPKIKDVEKNIEEQAKKDYGIESFKEIDVLE